MRDACAYEGRSRNRASQSKQSYVIQSSGEARDRSSERCRENWRDLMASRSWWDVKRTAQNLLQERPYDEPRSASRLHNPRLRLRDRQVPRGGDEPRSWICRGKGTGLRQSRTPAQSHGFGGTARDSLVSCLRQKSVLS